MIKTIIISMILFSSALLFAQADKAGLTSEEINDITSKLTMKLLLNDSQKNGIIRLLNTYSIELEKINSGSGESSYKNKEELISSINSQIEALLDSKQKMKYDVLKKEWWNSIAVEEND